VECTIRRSTAAENASAPVVRVSRTSPNASASRPSCNGSCNHDQLTKLFNRQYFENALEQELSALKRSTERSALPVHRPRPLQADQRHRRARRGPTRSPDEHRQKLTVRGPAVDRRTLVGRRGSRCCCAMVDEARVVALAEQSASSSTRCASCHEGRAFEVSAASASAASTSHALACPRHELVRTQRAAFAKRQGRNRILCSTRPTTPRSWKASSNRGANGCDARLQAAPSCCSSNPFLDCGAPVLYGYEVFFAWRTRARAWRQARLAPGRALRHPVGAPTDGCSDRIAEWSYSQPPIGARLHINVATAPCSTSAIVSRFDGPLSAPGRVAHDSLCLELKKTAA